MPCTTQLSQLTCSKEPIVQQLPFGDGLATVQAQGREFDIIVLQQSPGLRFNRGALLNAGALLLAGSRYDHFVFHDVDTLPQLKANLPYTFPSGAKPLHLTPQGIHPRVNYEVSWEMSS